MKASRSIVRCGVVARYCCQTWVAIWMAEALLFRVEGPEESGEGVDGAGAEAVEAAWRLAGIVAGVFGRRAWAEDMVFRGGGILGVKEWCFEGIRCCREVQWRGGRKIN